jgi:hypothetical protein
MKKLLVLIVAFVASSMSAFAQIQLTPYVSSTISGVDDNNSAVIENRLRTLISQNGMESGYGTRFILAVKVNLLDRYVAPGAPPRIGQNMMVTLAIGDAESGTCFGSCTQEVKGLGETEQAAILSGFKNIRMTAELRKLVAESKQKIIDYYNQNGPMIIKRAQGLITKQDYEGAIAELAAIPQECSSYSQASSLMVKVYQANINHDATQMLAEARALWSADPNPGESAEQALSILAQINPGASCYNQAQSLMKQIQARAKQVSDRQYADEKAQIAHERQMEVRRLNAAASLEKARINACRDVAVAYCKSRPRVVYRTTVINRWW